MALTKYQQGTWNKLDIEGDRPHAEVSVLINTTMSSLTTSDFWVAVARNGKVHYQVFSSFEEMAEIMWYEWSHKKLFDFLNEYELQTVTSAQNFGYDFTEDSRKEYVPYIVSKDCCLYFNNGKCAEKFYTVSIDNIKTNPEDY